MDGLVELLIILFILLFPVLEAIAKRRRSGAGKGGEPELPGGEPGPPPAPVEGRDARRDRDEATSEVLLPEDLWEELTGERRRAEPGTAGEETEIATAEERPLESDEEPGGPWRERAEAEVEPGAADLPEPEGPIGRTEVGGGRDGTWEEPSPPGERERREVPEPDRAALLREVGAEEGGLRRRRASELAGIRPGRLGRRGAAPAAAREPHPLLGELDRQALRRAILYREILGPPKALED